MGFNLTEITNQQVPTQEQSSRNLVLVPINAGNVALSNFTIARSSSVTGFQYASSSYAGGTLTFLFYGSRIGIQTTRGSNFGKLTFMIDGMAFPTLDTSTTLGSFYNVPSMIATNLSDGPHTLTISKLDGNITAISGFLVDDSATANYYVRAGMDLWAMNPIDPVAVGLTDTTVASSAIWGYITIFNTTASPITVTLKTSFTTFAVLSVPANGVLAIPNPIYCNGSLKANASATGCNITIGGQM